MRVGVTLAVVGAVVGEWAGASTGLGGPDQPRPRIAVRHPADVRHARDDRARRDRALPHGRRRRASARRQSLSQPSRGGPRVVIASPSRSRVRRARDRTLRERVQCRADPSSAVSARPRAGVGARASTPIQLVVGLGYIPSVQFAPFYLAHQAGYYADAGLSVEFQNKIDPDLITLVGQGTIDVGIGDGTSVIPAVSQGIPIRYIATLYGQFPNIVFAKASSGITTAADLAGKKIGTPGRYGSGWIMLQAMLGTGRPDDQRRRDHRVPRLHAARRGRAGRGRRGDRLLQQRAGPARARRDEGGRPPHRRRRRRCRVPG